MSRRFLSALGTVVAVTGVAVAAYAHDGSHDKAKEEKQVTIQGELLDSACFTASDGGAKGADHAGCARKCLGSGIPAAILPDGAKDANAIRFLLTNPVVLAPHAGKTVKVEGTEHAAKHAIDVKKVFVKDGNNWKEVPLKDEHHNMGGEKEDKKDGHGGHKR